MVSQMKRPAGQACKNDHESSVGSGGASSTVERKTQYLFSNAWL